MSCWVIIAGILSVAVIFVAALEVVVRGWLTGGLVSEDPDALPMVEPAAPQPVKIGVQKCQELERLLGTFTQVHLIGGPADGLDVYVQGDLPHRMAVDGRLYQQTAAGSLRYLVLGIEEDDYVSKF